VAYAWVTLDGEDMGLYTNVETPGTAWMERTFGRDDGRLYEGGYPYYPESWDHADFFPHEARNFELETGEDVDHADVIAIADVVDAPGPGWDARADALVDLDALARFEVVEAWVGQWDGYTYAVNNSRVYVHPADGRARIVPSGLDWTFNDYGVDWSTPVSALGVACHADTACLARVRAAVDPVCDAIDGAGLVARFDEQAALIAPFVAADPRKEVDEHVLDAEQEAMRAWLGARSARVRGALGD
jgi:hypothetical protein